MRGTDYSPTKEFSKRVREILEPLGLGDLTEDTAMGALNGFADRLDSEALNELSCGNARNADTIWEAMSRIEVLAEEERAASRVIT